MEYREKKIWSEQANTADHYRSDYLDGVMRYLDKLNDESKKTRRAFMPPERFAQELEEYRNAYLRMLGIADCDINAPASYTCEEVGSDDFCRIYRYALDMPEGFPFYCLLMVPHIKEKRAPLVIAQHGGGGTPELCSNLHGKNNYNDMVHHVLERGAVVVAPQLLLWRHKDEAKSQRMHPIPYDRQQIDGTLKRHGKSITGLEISCIRRLISFFSAREDVDVEKIGMIGVSYGGYFTLHTMAADPRIKSGFANAVFNDRDCYPSFTDWGYHGSADLFGDAEVAALCAPRRLLLTVGKQDVVFDYRTAIPEAKRVEDYFKVLDAKEELRFLVWEGGHTVPSDPKEYDWFFDGLKKDR